MAGRAFHTRYSAWSTSTPAGTTSVVPASITIPINVPVELVSVEVLIPPGHAALTGWRLVESGQPVVPFEGNNQWIIGDDDLLRFDVGVEVGNGLAVQTYNIDVGAHSHYWRFRFADMDNDSPGAFLPAIITPLTATVEAG